MTQSISSGIRFLLRLGLSGLYRLAGPQALIATDHHLLTRFQGAGHSRKSGVKCHALHDSNR